MVLVDTSVWVDHFRGTNDCLVGLLNNGEAVCHPFIIGELGCGNLKNRREVISLMETLPTAYPVEHEEALFFIETHNLMGKGLGYMDIHLLAAALLSGVSLWTLDKKLEKAAEALNCAYKI